MLYPIIRRVRRPLLPPEDRPAVVVPVPMVVPAAQPVSSQTVERTDRDEEDEHGQREEVTESADAAKAPPTPDVPASVPPMEFALMEEPVASTPVPQETSKPTRTRHARKTKTEESSC